MGYEKREWQDDVTDLDKDFFDHLQNGIVDAHKRLDELPNGSNIELDTTLKESGKAADAKAVGDRIDEVDRFVTDLANGGLEIVTANHIIKQYPRDGVFPIEVGKRYKIAKVQDNATTWGFKLMVVFSVMGGSTTHKSYTLNFPDCHKYDDYLNLRIIDIGLSQTPTANGNYTVQLDAEINGEYKTIAIAYESDPNAVVELLYANIVGATECYLVNDDAYIDLGEDGKISSDITLGVDDSDNRIYLYIDGKPVGNGIKLPSGGASGDFIGNIQPDKTIIISGNIPEGKYTLMYEDEDGNKTEIGTINYTVAEKPVLGDIPIVWVRNIKIDKTTGVEAPDSTGQYCTNEVIELDPNGTYALSVTSWFNGDLGINYCYYDAGGKYLGYVSSEQKATTETLTPISGATGVKLRVWVGSGTQYQEQYLSAISMARTA